LKQSKLEQIRLYIDDFNKGVKDRGRMYGTIPQIEAKWWVLDQIYCLLEGIPVTNFWGPFLASKGFGSASASRRIKEMNLKNPYLKLMELRNEFERWRKKEINKLKKNEKNKTALKITKYKKMKNPKRHKVLLLGSKNAWSVD